MLGPSSRSANFSDSQLPAGVRRDGRVGPADRAPLRRGPGHDGRRLAWCRSERDQRRRRYAAHQSHGRGRAIRGRCAAARALHGRGFARRLSTDGQRRRHRWQSGHAGSGAVRLDGPRKGDGDRHENGHRRYPDDAHCRHGTAGKDARTAGREHRGRPGGVRAVADRLALRRTGAGQHPWHRHERLDPWKRSQLHDSPRWRLSRTTRDAVHGFPGRRAGRGVAGPARHAVRAQLGRRHDQHREPPADQHARGRPPG